MDGRPRYAKSDKGIWPQKKVSLEMIKTNER